MRRVVKRVDILTILESLMAYPVNNPNLINYIYCTTNFVTNRILSYDLLNNKEELLIVVDCISTVRYVIGDLWTPINLITLNLLEFVSRRVNVINLKSKSCPCTSIVEGITWCFNLF